MASAPPPPPKVNAPTLPWRDGLVALCLVVAAFQFYRSQPRDMVTDSNYTLLLAETLLHEQTFALDRHFVTPLPDYYPGGRQPVPYQAEPGFPYQIEVLPRGAAEPNRPRVYLWYPNFPAMLSVPLVALLNAKGLHATAADGRYDLAGEVAMQLWIAALLCAISAALAYLIARVWLPPPWSLLIALAFAVASPLWSTGSRAMWTSTWGVLILLAALWHVALVDEARTRLRPWLLGSLCAFLYFCRPALAVEVLAIMAWLGVRDRRGFVQTALVGAAWASLFALWSWLIAGHMLPSYYRHTHLGLGHFWQGLYGSLASPSRGVLVYSPFLLAALLALLWRRTSLFRPDEPSRRWPSRALLAMALLGTLGHAAMLAGYPNWWGGHSYGARLMIDTLPLTVVWTVGALAVVRATAPQTSRIVQVTLGVLALALTAAGTWMHWRGVSDRQTFRWNAWPHSIDEHSKRALDWRQPQFLAGLYEQPPPATLPDVAWDTVLAVGQRDQQRYLLHGWSDAEGDFRWTDGQLATLCARLPAAQAHALELMVRPYLDVRPDGKGPKHQRVVVEVNGQSVGEAVLSHAGVQPLRFAVPASVGRDVVVRLRLPDAMAPAQADDGDDTRALGLAVFKLRWTDLPPR